MANGDDFGSVVFHTIDDAMIAKENLTDICLSVSVDEILSELTADKGAAKVSAAIGGM